MQKTLSDLTPNGLSEIRKLIPANPSGKQKFTVSIILQVENVTTKKEDKYNDKTLYVAMTDGKCLETDFLLRIKNDTIEKGDLILIEEISFSKLDAQRTLTFVRKFQIVAKKLPLKEEHEYKNKSKQRKETKARNRIQNGSEQKPNFKSETSSSPPRTAMFQNNLKKEEKPSENLKKNNVVNEPSNNGKNNEDFGEFDESGCNLIEHVTSFTRNPNFYLMCKKATGRINFKTKEGFLINYTFQDTHGSEIMGVAFKEEAEKLEPIIKEGKCYYIKGAFIKLDDKKFSGCKCDYRIHLGGSTNVQQVPNNGKFSKIKLDFTKLSELSNITNNSLIDIHIIVLDPGVVTEVNTKNGPKNLRRVMIGDDSSYKTELTLWSPLCNEDIEKDQILVIRALRINEFNGVRKLSNVSNSQIIKNYDDKLDQKLKVFASEHGIEDYQLTDNGIAMQSSEPETFTMVKDILNEEEPKAVKLYVTLTHFRNDVKNYYLGCPNQKCRKKLAVKDGTLICEKCGEINEAKYYYTLNFEVSDCSGRIWCDLFGDAGGLLTGMKAEDYKELIEAEDAAKLNTIYDNIVFKRYIVIGKMRVSNYNNVDRKKFSVWKIKDSEKEYISWFTKYFRDNLKI